MPTPSKFVFVYGPIARLRGNPPSHATELLTAGTSIETVAALLGHSSTKVTEKSYSHWVRGRQESLEAAVKNAWAHLDPLVAEPA
jgi:integrase